MSGPIRSQYITFIGTLANGEKEPEQNIVEVLAGEGAPTVTGGWPEWMTLSRPQRVGMTVLQGYPPIKLSIPIRFEAILQSERTTPLGGPYDIEHEIQKLEWMGGRGRPLGTHPKPGGIFHGTPGHDALGDSPLIEVRTNSEAKMIALVPVQFQEMGWVLDGEAGGISFDPNPLRDVGGARLRQLATVYLKQFVSSPGTGADSPVERAKARAGGKGKGIIVSTTSALNTIQKLVIHYTHSTAGVQETIQRNRGNRAVGTNPDKPLPVGLKISIPYNAIHHLGNG